MTNHFGAYLQYNVALPPAILSRFDLVYVMIDDPDDQTDYHIAHHIVRVHQKREEALTPAFTTAQLKRYIAYAKTLKPKVFCSDLEVHDLSSTTLWKLYLFNFDISNAAKRRSQRTFGGLLCCSSQR